ncbi:MAG TPA: hypothetical protein VLT56_12980 [Desulfobacterales bacterium]|nr:hypothetical protein [Desulfobacterales bacterium]
MKTGLESQRVPEGDVTSLLREMRLEEAIRLLKRPGCKVDSAAVKAMILGYETRANQMQTAGETGEARRMARRAAALNGLLVHGPDPTQMVAETELPEGYAGKILLVLLTGGSFADMVCLRSGDDWHREILHNTRAEIADLGFPDARVHPLGGAYAGFDSDGSIVIRGTSDEFGCCDKDLAARLIARAYPGRMVTIED